MKVRLATLALAPTAALLAFAGGGQAQDSSGGVSSVEVSQGGRQVYVEVCQACHMADARGAGAAGAGFPALADNPKLADKAYVVDIMVKGRGGMPWFTDLLTPAQIAAVSTHIRSDFNAYSDPVTVAEVEAMIASAGASAEQ